MNILLAVGDMRFSDAALDAIVAQRRPHAQNTSVRVVHVIDLPPLLTARELIGDDVELEKTWESEREKERAAVTIVADELRSHDIRAAASVEIGDAKAKILEIANQWPADLVIVGAPKPWGLQSLLRRSVSLSVAKHAPCSVEIVRNAEQVLESITEILAWRGRQLFQRASPRGYARGEHLLLGGGKCDFL